MTALDATPTDDTPRVLALGSARLLAGAGYRSVTHDEHRAMAGPLRQRSLEWLRDAAQTVGLLGRGGAAFPVSVKLAAVPVGRRTEVLVNGSESEPASLKDRALMRRAPHQVLDGALIVAAALRARRVTIAVHDSSSADTLAAACAERTDAAEVQVVLAPGGFVTGEVQALVNRLDGRAGVPNGRRTLPSDRGLRGRPTFASNAETFAQLGVLAALGPHAYADLGCAAEPGTSLVTLMGDVPTPGVAEVPNGTPLDALTGASGRRPVLMGGYHGTWTRVRGLTLDRAGLRRRGLAWGAGVLAVLPESTCPVGELARVVHWLAGESTGQCGPCIFGLASVSHDLTRLYYGEPVDIADLRRRLGLVDGRGACGHPSGAVRFAATALDAFDDEVAAHGSGRGCGRPVLGVLPVQGGSR